jgi:phosphodiesterase/alkaline phosphatase D-like protein
VTVSADLTGLASGTTYYFRVVATSTAGTSYGDQGSFTTGSAPVVVTQDATTVTTSGATLNGTVDPGRLATTYRFEYGTTTGYGSQSTSANAGSGSSPVSESLTLSGLAPDTTYHFRIVATNAAGTTTGDDAMFTTSTTPPSVTTGVASAVLETSATLGGTLDPHGVDTTYRFEYGPTTLYGSQSAAASAGSGSGASDVSADLSGLAPSTTYHFRLVATNAGGTSTGDDATFTTPARPADPPAQTTPPQTGSTLPTTDTEPVTTPPVITTPPAACKPALKIARHRRMAVLTIRCAPAGKLTAVVMRGKHRLVRARRAHNGTGDMKLRLRIPRRAFGHATSLRLVVKVTVAGATGAPQVLRRRVTIRT